MSNSDNTTSAPPQPKSLNESVRFTEKVVKDGLRKVATHHVESFNYGMGKCLPRICKYMLPVEVTSQSAQPSSAPDSAATTVNTTPNPKDGEQYPF